MNILFDYQIFYLQKFGGISKYFYNLAINLKKKNLNPKILAPISKNYYSKDLKKNQILDGICLDKFPKFTSKLIGEYNFISTNYLISRYNADIIHLTYYNKIYKLKLSIPKIITVYDLIHEKYPHYYTKNFHSKKESIKYADHIICISNNTKKDLLEYYNIEESKISVIYLGVDQNIENIEKIKSKKNFILFVGDRKKYKNFKNFILAFSQSEILSKEFDVICFGGGKFNSDEFKLFKDIKLPSSKIIQVTGNDLQLKSYFASASFLIFPSLYEGFGLPLLEAMSLNCPVLCSNSSSLKEIGGESAIFFDPNDIENIKFTMENFAFNETNKDEIIFKGKKNSEKYTWEKCTRETLNIYKNLRK